MHMSKGRMTFAIGAGEEKQFEPFGEARTKPFGRMEEAINTWKTLWQSGGQPLAKHPNVGWIAIAAAVIEAARRGRSGATRTRWVTSCGPRICASR